MRLLVDLLKLAIKCAALIVIVAMIIHWMSGNSEQSGETVNTAGDQQHDEQVSAMQQQAAREVSGLASQHSGPTGSTTPPAQQTKTPAPPACATDYRLCRDNAAVVNDYRGITHARTTCETETEDSVAYGRPDWGGFFSVPFGKFLPGEDAPRTGVVTMIDDSVELQNQFGAMAKSEVVCRYNLHTRAVVSLTINGEPVQLGHVQQ